MRHKSMDSGRDVVSIDSTSLLIPVQSFVFLENKKSCI